VFLGDVSIASAKQIDEEWASAVYDEALKKPKKEKGLLFFLPNLSYN